MILAVTTVLSGFVGTGSNAVKADDTVSGLNFAEEQVTEINGTTYRFQAYWANVQSSDTTAYSYKEQGIQKQHTVC